MTSPPTTSIAPAARPFVAAGALAVVAGGIAAAVTGPTGWDHGSWVAAFLVLVTGVGQTGLGVGQAMIAGSTVTSRRIAIEVASLNGGCLTVITGTLSAIPIMVSVGGVTLASALGVLAVTAHHAPGTRAWVRRAYTGLLTVLLVSTPIGLTLAWMRA